MYSFLVYVYMTKVHFAYLFIFKSISIRLNQSCLFKKLVHLIDQQVQWDWFNIGRIQELIILI